ncbi:hypothetical protein DQ04_02321070 [Trypanosoma grayi]|uniref:hypothetical protein n=1 Tax=Trypanosoma grayi TaxID=71804 RepID=UPI0004F4217B|nr:hypothetical protein DQ04_02321070 [Trypanosoma grayi]KEG11743.1 hypothetical protein DQ04_02321070 [Trypanosoma grayi]
MPWAPSLASPLSLLLLLLLAASLQQAAAEVYIKLLPGKELCLNYEGYRDPEEDPPLVDVRHRTLNPRAVNIRTRLYSPSGALTTPTGRIDPYGTPSSFFFKVEETGTYRLCMRTPLSHPPLKMEMRFSGEKDLIAPTTTVEGAEVVDKPVEVEDYRDRLHMLDVSVEVTLDEVRMSENRLHMLDETMRSTYYRVVGMLALNVVVAVGLNVWAEKHLERYFVKKKIV